MTKKIMFNDKFLLTKAVLDGRKTQTRRVVPQSEMDKINLFQKEYYGLTFDKLEGAELINHYYFVEKRGRLPYQIGEVVAWRKAIVIVEVFVKTECRRGRLYPKKQAVQMPDGAIRCLFGQNSCPTKYA